MYAELLCQNDSNWKAVSASRTKRQKLLKGKSVRTLVPRPPTARPTAFILRHGSQSIGVPSHLPASALIARIRKRRTNLSFSCSSYAAPVDRLSSARSFPRRLLRSASVLTRAFLGHVPMTCDRMRRLVSRLLAPRRSRGIVPLPSFPPRGKLSSRRREFELLRRLRAEIPRVVACRPAALAT